MAQTQLDRVEAKLDLVFGMFSNQLMASQAIEAFQATQGKDDEQSKDINAKSESAFRHHNKNMMDSVDYYISLFGAQSNEKLVKLLREAGYGEAKNEAPSEADIADEPGLVVANDVKTSSSRQSIVDDSSYDDEARGD